MKKPCNHKPDLKSMEHLFLWTVAFGTWETLKIKCLICKKMIAGSEFKLGDPK